MKLPKLTQNEDAERLSIRVRESTMKNLRLYQKCYSDQYDVAITIPVLVEEMLKVFMRDDKDFAKYVQSLEALDAPAPAPAARKEREPSSPAQGNSLTTE